MKRKGILLFILFFLIINIVHSTDEPPFRLRIDPSEKGFTIRNENNINYNVIVDIEYHFFDGLNNRHEAKRTVVCVVKANSIFHWNSEEQDWYWFPIRITKAEIIEWL
jgi:hypothetical protein